MVEQPTREALITGTWYPAAEAYWVPTAEEDAWPHRYGDLFQTPANDAHGIPLMDKTGSPWHAVMVFSPSCELISKSKSTDTVEVIRVYRLDSQDPAAAQRIVAGWQEKEAVVGVAFAHTIFLAPVTGYPTHDQPMFANLKSTARVTLADLRQARRIAALTHEARTSVIRRDLYYRYRWLVSTDAVQAAEQRRVSTDPYFTGPRPAWAPLALP